MVRGPCTFTKRDIDVAFKAAFEAGAEHVRVVIVSKAGKMLIQASKSEPADRIDKNDWDEA
jgi:hypothetical protein